VFMGEGVCVCVGILSSLSPSFKLYVPKCLLLINSTFFPQCINISITSMALRKDYLPNSTHRLVIYIVYKVKKSLI